MILAGQPVLSAQAMRAAEDMAIAAGTRAELLMARAGAAVAEWAVRLAAGAPVLVLCGPGNNGGDGYVAAAVLAAGGHAVRVAASGEPTTAAAQAARAGWSGPVATLAQVEPAAVVVDALFGIGLSRPLDDAVAAPLHRLVAQARLAIAVDLPSGVGADDARVMIADGTMPAFDLTLALGALKPAHVLQPAARYMGAVRIVDIGLPPPVSRVSVIARPDLPPPGPDAHKYSRGMVSVVVGAMPGAARLAAVAAARAGAGYVALHGDAGPGTPDAIVHRARDAASLREQRIGAIVVGPGLGRDDEARRLVETLIDDDAHPLVIDGDALRLVDPARLRGRQHAVVLTPHAGEFDALFGADGGNNIDRALAAAERAGAVVVFKGATTVVAGGGAAIVHPGGSGWLSTAGTGDVLAGAIGAMLAGGGDAATAAAAGVWLHGEAARRLGARFIADDLAHALTAAGGAS